jgi:hypothetical protein
MRNLVTGWMIQQDGGIAHAVDLDHASTMTVCNEGPADVTAETWADAPTPRCKRCSDLLASGSEPWTAATDVAGTVPA